MDWLSGFIFPKKFIFFWVLVTGCWVLGADVIRVLDPDATSKKLLDRAMAHLPKTLPESKLNVDTYKKLES